MQSINPHAVKGEPGTGFEKRGKKGPFQCSNCEYFDKDSCGQADMMKKSKEPKLANGRVKVDAEDCCEFVDRISAKRGFAARFGKLSVLLFAALFYQKATVEDLALGKVHMTRVQVSGKVTLVKKEADGDLHIRVSDGKHFIVAECMPQIPCRRPHIGQAVTVKGISRFDGEHKWYEIHPVTEIQ